MSGEPVTFVYTEEQTTQIFAWHVYTFRADRKFHWLQRLCCRVLAKIGAQYHYDHITQKCVTFYPETLIHAIERQADDVYRRTHRLPERVIMGSKNWSELMKTPNVQRYIAIHFPTKSVMGLTVEIVPWMDGIVVLP